MAIIHLLAVIGVGVGFFGVVVNGIDWFSAVSFWWKVEDKFSPAASAAMKKQHEAFLEIMACCVIAIISSLGLPK